MLENRKIVVATIRTKNMLQKRRATDVHICLFGDNCERQLMTRPDLPYQEIRTYIGFVTQRCKCVCVVFAYRIEYDYIARLKFGISSAMMRHHKCTKHMYICYIKKIFQIYSQYLFGHRSKGIFSKNTFAQTSSAVCAQTHGKYVYIMLITPLGDRKLQAFRGEK